MATIDPTPAAAICPEKERLLDQYRKVLSDYSRAVRILEERAGVLSRDAYISVRDYSEMARMNAEAVRNEMDRHIAEHGC